MTTDELRKLALAATPKKHTHGFAIADRRDCSMCWEPMSAAQELHAALSPERILALLDIIENYASHHNWCAGNDCGKCTCGKDAAMAAL